eukprot:UC1_evm1s536
MGAGISQIDNGLFICGVDALKLKDLKERKISHILNVAQRQLYSRPAEECGGGRDGFSTMDEMLHHHFTVKIIGAADEARQQLQPVFREMADFIAAGRAAGGVVVHCAAGISRATTGCLSYMLLHQHIQLEAALTRIYYVRDIVHPNEGFWSQLRALEASILADGVELRGLLRGELDALKPASDNAGSGGMGAGGHFSHQSAAALIVELDRRAECVSPRIHITAHVTTRGPRAAEAARNLREAARRGEFPQPVFIENVAVVSDDLIGVRMSVACSSMGLGRAAMSDESLEKVLTHFASLPLVDSIDIEHIG